MYEDIINQILPLVSPNRREAVKKNISYIIDALRNEGILTPKVLAYALATVAHETGGLLWTSMRKND